MARSKAKVLETETNAVAVYEVCRYIVLNELNQVESSTTINKLNEATFGVFGSEHPQRDKNLTGSLKKVTLTISVEDYVPPQAELEAESLESYEEDQVPESDPPSDA